MKSLRLLAATVALLSTPALAGEARFDWFSYQGQGAGPTPGPGEYRNPVLPGFYPDPSIVRVGADLFLVNSTFSWFPGIPVWRSRDLVHWQQVANAISRPTQLDFKRLDISRGVFAPAISHHGGQFQIVNTCVDCGGNYVVTARDPAGPWSDPIWLKDVGGIDPSLFFDDDGRAWLVNNDAPDGKPLYEGHRAIWLREVDPATFRSKGPARVLVNGGVDLSKRPVWIEGPHLFKHEGRYYLSAAEGGTSVNHSQVIFRADSLAGPFVPAPAPINPILTQRDLDPARLNPISAAGHADLVQLADGAWWAVFLGTRPYKGDLYNTGRETFLLPVTWRDGWPTILPGGRAIPTIAAAPKLPRGAGAAPGEPAIVRDEFAGVTLAPYWLTMRTPTAPVYRVAGGALVLTPGEGIGSHGRPAYVARRQQQANATVTTAVRFQPSEGEAAGLAAVQNDDWFLTVAVTRREGRDRVEVRRRAGPDEPVAGKLVAEVPLAAEKGAPVELRMVARGGEYDFAYASRPGRWVDVAKGVDGTVLSTERAGGFVGTMIGPFAEKR